MLMDSRGSHFARQTFHRGILEIFPQCWWGRMSKTYLNIFQADVPRALLYAVALQGHNRALVHLLKQTQDGFVGKIGALPAGRKSKGIWGRKPEGQNRSRTPWLLSLKKLEFEDAFLRATG